MLIASATRASSIGVSCLIVTLVLFAGWTGVLASTSATFVEALVLLTVFFSACLDQKIALAWKN